MEQTVGRQPYSAFPIPSPGICWGTSPGIHSDRQFLPQERAWGASESRGKEP